MANTFLTNSIITKEALAILENSLTAAERINRTYDDRFRFGGAVLGQTLSVRKPARFIGRQGQAVNIEGINEQYATITLAYQRGIDTTVSSQDLVTSIDEYSETVLKPQVARVANLVDQDVCALALQLNNHVGTPGTTPTALDTYWSARTKLNNFAAPMDDRTFLLNPLAEQKIGNALYTAFNPQKNISDIYRTGAMGAALGADWFMDQNVYTHTVGTLTGTPLVNGGSQSGSSIITDGWTSGDSLNQGDIVSFGAASGAAASTGSFAVNPQSYQSTGQLAQFVVTATTTTTGSMTIPISPAMVGPGNQTTNVTNLPADNAVVLVFDTLAASFSGITGKSTPQNLHFNKDFGTLVRVDLPEPGGTDMAKVMSSKQGRVSCRVIRQYQATTDQWIQRIDVLYGVAVLRQELACRIAG